jgi:hypothetical protein
VDEPVIGLHVKFRAVGIEVVTGLESCQSEPQCIFLPGRDNSREAGPKRPEPVNFVDLYVAIAEPSKEAEFFR